MAENTVRLHRVLRAPAERIYRAFQNPNAMVKWLPPHGFTGKVHHIKAEVGGTYKTSFTNLTTGQSHSFGGEFLELVPERAHPPHGQVRRPEPAWLESESRTSLPPQLEWRRRLKSVAVPAARSADELGTWCPSCARRTCEREALCDSALNILKRYGTNGGRGEARCQKLANAERAAYALRRW